MLSAESAAGQYPIEAVSMMNRIAEEVETDVNYLPVLAGQRASPESTGADAIAAAARQIAETIDTRAIVAWTSSGATGLRIARERPRTPIIVLTPAIETARRMALVWGTHAIVESDPRNSGDMVNRASRAVQHEEFAKVGDRIIVVAGVPFGTPGATNMIRIAYVS
jgi:pyruvate kinase